MFWAKAYDRSKTLAAAEKARSRGRVRKAVRCYLKVLEHAPDDHVVRSKVAPLLARAKRWDESRQNFDKAANGYLDAGFVPKAIAVWTVAAQTFPEQVDYWERIANEQVKRGKRQDAVLALLQGRSMLRRKRQRPLAVLLLRQVLELEPGHVDSDHRSWPTCSGATGRATRPSGCSRDCWSASERCAACGAGCDSRSSASSRRSAPRSTGFSLAELSHEKEDAMERLYFWPTNPAASLFALWVLSQVFLYAARVPVHRALREVGRLLGGVFRIGARWCRGLAGVAARRDHEMIVEMGKGDTEAKIGREFHRIEGAFAKELARYPDLHRKLDDVVTKVDADFQECATAAPAAPGWSDAVQAVAKMPPNGDPVVSKVLEEIQKSAIAGEKKALQEFRDATSKKHKILSSMAPAWKELQKLATDVARAVTGALEATKRIDGFMTSYEKVRAADSKAIRALGWNATQLFVVSLLVMAVALGGAFVNFNLIALPMSELVPSGSRIGGMPVATVAALVVVLMEIAAGVFAMEMLGITSFFPKLELLPKSRRRIILVVALGGLFMLACIEASLAVLREQIVESSTALKASLAGVHETAVAQTAQLADSGGGPGGARVHPPLDPRDGGGAAGDDDLHRRPHRAQRVRPG